MTVTRVLSHLYDRRPTGMTMRAHTGRAGVIRVAAGVIQLPAPDKAGPEQRAGRTSSALVLRPGAGVGEALLAPGLVDRDGGGVGQVQRAATRQHRDDQSVGDARVVQYLGRESGRFG